MSQELRLLVVVMSLVLSACGSSGSGSGTYQETKPIQPPVTDPLVKFSVYGDTKKIDDQIVLKPNNKFYYVLDGVELVLNDGQNSLMDSLTYKTVDNQTKVIALSKLGSSHGYSYMNFGNVLKGKSFGDASQVAIYYYGYPTIQMPFVGQAIYKGFLWGNQGDFTDVKFNVDYGNKTIQGITGGLSTLTQEISFNQGSIVGNAFSGKTQVVGQTSSVGGSYSGMFFGPKAEELGGITTISPTLDAQKFSFGAKKQ